MAETDEKAMLVEGLLEIVRMYEGDKHPRSEEWGGPRWSGSEGGANGCSC
jgi:hypothetical protein